MGPSFHECGACSAAQTALSSCVIACASSAPPRLTSSARMSSWSPAFQSGRFPNARSTCSWLFDASCSAGPSPDALTATLFDGYLYKRNVGGITALRCCWVKVQNAA